MQLLHEGYVFNVFVDNSDVTTDVHWISSAMNAFSHLQLIPSFGNELNPLTGEKRNFLRMVTPDESIQINIQSQMTSIILIKNDHIEIIINAMQSIFDGLVKLFPEKKSNRIAALTSTLAIASDDEYQAVFDTLHKPLTIGNENKPFEWDSRRAFKVNVEGIEGGMNSIISIRRGMHSLVNKPLQDTIAIDTDVNTQHENQTLRFKYSDINEKTATMLNETNNLREAAYTIIGIRNVSV